MAIGRYYTMEFKNVEDVFVKVLIGDNTIDAETPEIIQLDPAGSPLRISTIDEGENKFTPIKPQQVTITFLSNGNTSLQTFSDGADDRFSVTVLYGTTIVFYGFLSLSDNSEAFLPPRNQVVLTANDKLGALKEIPLTDSEGENPQGKYTIGNLIAMCLQKTGLSLQIRVLNNLRHEGSTGHIYNETFLDAKTFEEEIGISENCYDVLSKILGFDCFITQYKECWWICRIDEYDSNAMSVARFDENGEYVDSYVETTLTKGIGFNETHWLSDEATIVQPMRPIGFDKLTYNFVNPLEIVCNQDFDRGAFIEDLPEEENEDGVMEQVKSYTLDCWDWLSRAAGSFTYSNFGQPATSGSELYVKKFYFNDTETDKELVILNNTSFGPNYVQSELIPVYIKDKITLSISVYYTDIGGASAFTNSPVLVALFANNGDIYWWKAHNVLSPDAEQEWNLIPVANFLTDGIWYAGAGLDDPPLDMSFTSPPVPVSGKIRVFIINEYGSGVVAHYSIPEISITQFINGSYKNYKGRYDKVSRTETGYLSNIVEEVFISDAERILFKGALLKEGAADEIYSGIADFGGLGQIEIDGDVEDDFTVGERIIVSGSAGNNITATVTGTSYSIIGDLTTITTDGTTTTEINATVVINKVGYVLTDQWYDASKYTIGDPDIIIQPYGWLQAYSVWNQYRLANRIFQYQFQGFGADIPSLVHKYSITDVSGHSENRNFLMLTKDADLFLCNQTGVLEQVYHTEEGKVYTDEHEFKYIS